MSRDPDQDLRSKVLEVQKELDKINSEHSDKNAIVEFLNTLKDIPMSLDVLKSTRIGDTVNKLRRASQDEQVKSLARTIILKWRQLLLPEDGSGSFSNSTNNNPPSGGGTKRTVNDSDSDVVSSNKQRKIDGVGGSQDQGKDSNTNTGTTDDDDSNHPLLNHIVLSTMAKYLPPADLLSLRLTCKRWNEARDRNSNIRFIRIFAWLFVSNNIRIVVKNIRILELFSRAPLLE